MFSGRYILPSPRPTRQHANTGRHKPLYQRSLAIRENALGPEHPYVAWSLDGLARTHTAKGQYTNADALFNRSLAIRENALGVEHPDVATSLENYALLLRDMGRSEEADRLEAHARAIRANNA